jgi:hypothetical protein
MLQNSGHVSWSWFIMMKCYQHRKKPSLSVHWLSCPMFHAFSYFGLWEIDEPAPTMHIPPCHCEKSMFRKEGWSYLVTMFKSLSFVQIVAKHRWNYKTTRVSSNSQQNTLHGRWKCATRGAWVLAQSGAFWYWMKET